MSVNTQQDSQQEVVVGDTQKQPGDLTQSTLSVLVERADKLIFKHRVF